MTDKAMQPGIRLETIALRTLHFSHLSDLPAEVPLTAAHEIMLGVEPASSPGKYLITAGVRTPTEHPGPYRFEVVMEALVSQDELAPNMGVEEYARNSGWALLFPFIRERLADVTSRGRFGPYLLPPANVMALVTARGDMANEPRQ